MAVYEINPQNDRRWTALVDSHFNSSVFHTPAWLEALRRTYGYTIKVYSSNSTGTLTNGIVFCQIMSWLTGARLVSLPFSDHCEPLVRDGEELDELLSDVQKSITGKLRYAEIRPRRMRLSGTRARFQSFAQYCLHTIDLGPSTEQLFTNLDKDSVQRKVRRAKREGLTVEQGQSELLLKQFYGLLLLTRRRHHVPPQPSAWFRNLIDCFGSRLTIYVARVKDRPVASILTIRHKSTIVYKYGCSDVAFHNLGGMPFLFWQAIEQAKSEGMHEFDLGRSDLSGTGLIRFKDQLGAQKTSLNYWRRYREASRDTHQSRQFVFAQNFVSHLPDGLFRLAGELFYRHAG